MSLGSSIYAALLADAAVNALVSDRIYKLRAPQGVLAPYVVWQGIGSDPGVTHTGPSGATERLVQFACFAVTAEGASDLRDAVVAALDGVELANGDNGTLEDDNRESYEEPVSLYRADADFLF